MGTPVVRALVPAWRQSRVDAPDGSGAKALGDHVMTNRADATKVLDQQEPTIDT